MKTLTIRIPDEFQQALLKISAEEKKTVSDLVRESIQKLIKIESFRIVRNRMIPSAENKGIVTDEDVFRFLA
jgi:predicted DNA-binding protein